MKKLIITLTLVFGFSSSAFSTPRSYYHRDQNGRLSSGTVDIQDNQPIAKQNWYQPLGSNNTVESLSNSNRNDAQAELTRQQALLIQEQRRMLAAQREQLQRQNQSNENN